MNTPHMLASATLALASFVQLEAATTILLNETFDSYADNAALNAAGWYYRNTNSAGGLWPGPVAIENGVLTGRVLRGGGTGGSAANTWILKQWSGTTLAGIGDSITLSFDALFSGSDEFNASLFDASQTIAANALGGASPIAGATGYGYMQTFGATPVAGVISTLAGSGINAGSTTPSTSSNDLNTLRDSLTTIPTITGAIHTFSLSITKVETGATISFFRDDALLSSWTDTSATGDLDFNTLKIRLTGSTNSRYIDNVLLTHSAIPEPAAAAALAGLAALGLVANRRRRR